MALTLSIPAIAITPEAEEDDDHNFLNLSEALTDIEELYDDNVSTKKVVTRHKLKIKVTESDGYSTALEDMEASEDEDFITLKTHVTPIIIDAIDMEQYSVEENQGSTEKYIKKYDYLNWNSNMICNGKGSNNNINFINSAITDIEDYDTDNEIENDDDENENEVILDLDDYGETIESVKISDEIQDLKQNWGVESFQNSDQISNHSYEKNDVKYNKKRPPTFREMFRGQNKSVGNNNNKTTRRKKRNRMRSTKESRTFDDAESSDTELIELKNRVKWSNMNSLNYDSDVEDNKLPFPLCKKTFEKKKILLETPDNNNLSNITDVEDIECDVDLSEKNLAIDNKLIQEQLDEMSSCYSFTKDKNESKLKETDDMIIQESCLPFTEQHSKIKQPSKSFNDCLLAPMNNNTDGGSTDIEHLDSSSENDESETNNEEVKKADVTDEENLESDIFLDAFDFPEVSLPPSSRLLIISEEKNTLIPTMRILPLDENIFTDSDVDSACTDNESVNSSIDESLKNLLRDLPSPQVGNLEGGSIKDFENYVNTKAYKNTLYEELTDTEYLHPESQNRFIKTKKNKKGNYLHANNILYNIHTDVESLDSFSCNSGLESPLPQIHTDLEYLDSTDDEEEPKRPNKKCNKMKFQRESRFLAIGLTDTEDILASTDDEITFSRVETSTPYKLRNALDQASSIQMNIENSSKIDCSAPEEAMYLKGSGFQEVLADTEELMVDTEVQRSEAIEAWEYFNTQDTNEDGTSVGRNIPTSTAREGGEEAGEQLLRQQFHDQHQLSEEMKELLKEMEKSSEH